MSSHHLFLNPVLTIGMFDGVHKGHQAVLADTLTTAGVLNAPSLILTFDSHPAALLRPDKLPLLITSSAHRQKLLETFRPDHILYLPFTYEFSRLTAEEFLHIYKPQVLWLGHDARIGKDRTGDPQQLGMLSRQMNFKVRYQSPLTYEGLPISSSRIRNEIAKGNLALASELLGRPYSLYLEDSHDGLVLPPDGVYEGKVLGENALLRIENRRTHVENSFTGEFIFNY